MTIRLATVNDIPAIQKLAETIWWDHFPSIISNAQIVYMLEIMYRTERIQSDMSAGIQWFIKTENAKPVGFAALGPGEREGQFKLQKLYILPEEQGRGHARAFFDYLIDLVKEAGGDTIQLTVNRRNAKAKACYEHIGFKTVGEIDMDIGHGFVMDDYVMEKGLE